MEKKEKIQIIGWISLFLLILYIINLIITIINKSFTIKNSITIAIRLIFYSWFTNKALIKKNKLSDKEFIGFWIIFFLIEIMPFVLIITLSISNNIVFGLIVSIISIIVVYRIILTIVDWRKS